MTEYLFSYGTLQKDHVQLKLFGRLLHGSTDRLNGYKVKWVEIMDEQFLAGGENKNQMTIIFSNNKNDFIEGTALQVTPDELLLADKYEPHNYKRIHITLESGKHAWVYTKV